MRPRLYPLVCSVPGCTRDHLAKGYCGLHYQWNRRRVVASAAPRTTPAPAAEPVNRPYGCGTCGFPASFRPTAHADWCARVQAAAPYFVGARVRAEMIREAEARAAGREAS